MGRSWRDLKADRGASLVEYSLAVVLIGVVAVLAVGFVGRSTSEAFDDVGSAFPTDQLAASLGDDVTSDVFDDLLARIEGIDSPGDSLAGKAKDAETRYLEGDVDGAISKLNSLVKEVDLQQGKQLTYDDAASVRNGAQDLLEAIRTG
jgi:Flp pilus assembly pilin Flp